MISRVALAIAFIGLGAVPALAGLGACASTQPLNSTVVGPANGCTAVNSSFLNFDVMTATGNALTSFPVATAGAASAIEFTTSSTSETATVHFLTTGQYNDAQYTVCAGNSWCVVEQATQQNGTQSFTYETQSAQILGLQLLLGTVNPNYLEPGDIVQITEEFCLGAASFAGCTTSSTGYGYLQILTTSQNDNQLYTTTYSVCTPHAGACVLTTGLSAAGLNFAAQTQIAIEDTVQVMTPATGIGVRAFFVDDFSNEFVDSPEPGTFGMLGASLLAMLMARRRFSGMSSTSTGTFLPPADRAL